MKQRLGVKKEYKQTQTISSRQIQYLDFMMLGHHDLEDMIHDVFETNPTIEIKDGFERERSLIFDDILNVYVVQKTLKDDLYHQLLGRPNLNYDIMSYLIESLDDFGFISVPDAVLAQELGINNEAAARYRKALQHFEPLGIGSQGVKENITIQLEADGDVIGTLAVKVLDEFLSKNNYDESLILKYYDIDKETLDHVLNRIHSCTPKFEMEQKQNERVFPDVFIRVDQHEIVCEMSRNYEKLRINYEYENNDDEQIKIWYRESEVLLENIRFRNSTLLAIVNKIVDRQKGFFLMQKHLEPLTLSDIADDLNLNVSTISRSLSNKTVFFNREVYKMSDFFITATKNGNSADVIKRRIVKIVNNETRVLSDQKIADIIKDEGIQVERRTVAKYRKELSIPSSSERRRIKKWD